MIDLIENKLKKVKKNKTYTPDEIVKLGVIVNTKLKPSAFVIYRIIKDGRLPAINLGTNTMPKYRVKGSDLIAFVKKTWNL